MKWDDTKTTTCRRSLASWRYRGSGPRKVVPAAAGSGVSALDFGFLFRDSLLELDSALSRTLRLATRSRLGCFCASGPCKAYVTRNQTPLSGGWQATQYFQERRSRRLVHQLYCMSCFTNLALFLQLCFPLDLFLRCRQNR